MKQSINLMQSEAQQGLTLTRMTYLLVGFSVLLLVVVLFMIIQLGMLKHQQSNLNLEQSPPALQEEPQSDLNQHELEYNALKSILDHAVYKPLWVKHLNPFSMSRVMTVFASSPVQDLWLDTISVDFSKNTFSLLGKSQTPMAVMDWLRFLRQMNTFGQASLVNVELNQSQAEYSFKVEGRL